jgi:hypothetical protein
LRGEKVKHVLGYVAKIAFYMLCAALITWTASLTVSFVSRILPQAQVEPYLALAVFDGGALVWLLVFLYHAEGLGQRAISLLMLVADLLGVALMTVSELMLGGQTFTTPPANLGTIAVWGIGLMTFANVAAAYAFHVVDPTSMEMITAGVAKDRVKARGMKYLEEHLDQLGESLGAEMGRALVEQSVRDLGLHLPAGEVIDVVAKDTEPKEKRKQRRIFYRAPARQVFAADTEAPTLLSTSPNGHRPGDLTGREL